MKQQKKVNDSLLVVLKLKKEESITLKKKNDYLFLLSGNFSKYFPNKISLFDYAFEKLKKENNLERFILMNDEAIFSRDISFQRETYNFGFKDYNKNKAFAYLFKTVRRDSAFIKNFFSDEEKKHIFQTVKSSEWYEKSDFKDFIKALLLSYNDIERNNINGNTYAYMQSSEYDKWKIAGEEIHTLLSFTNEYGTFCCGNLLGYTQQFWLRRKIEGNQQVVHNMLNEFDAYVVEK